MRPSYSDLDPTCAHVDHDPGPALVPYTPPAHPTRLELVIGSIVGGAAATFIVLVLLGLVG